MAYLTSILGLWPFSGSLEDEIDPTRNLSRSSLAISNSYINFQVFDIIIGSLQTKQGLVFVDGQWWYSESNYLFNSGSSYRLDISFWWYSPAAVGYTRHAVNKKNIPYICPIIAKADSVTSGAEETITSGEFVILETAASSSQNVIQLTLLPDGINPSVIVQSEPYSPGLHHVLVSYVSDGEIGVARIDIDGGRGYEQPVTATFTPTLSALRINKVGYGSTLYKKYQTGGFISELLMRRADSSETDDAARFYYLGYDYVVDDVKMLQNFDFMGFAFHQPTTISTTQLYVEGGSIYAARSDGTLWKGHKPIWDREFTYETEEAVDNLTVGETDGTNRVAEWTEAGLQLKGTTVKV